MLEVPVAYTRALKKKDDGRIQIDSWASGIPGDGTWEGVSLKL